MQEIWGALFIFVICPLLGSLPLIEALFWLATGQRLSRLGTGNISVSAAFYHGGTWLGIGAVITEALKGILAVVITRYFFPVGSAWELLALIAVVMGRYWGGKGAGVTNALWGLLFHDPLGTSLALITGMLSFTVLRDRASGRLAGLFWLVVILTVRHSWVSGYWLGILALAGTLVTILQKIPDDLDLETSTASPETQKMFRFFRGDQAILTLNRRLKPEKVGAKAATLATLKRLGYPVAEGWILRPGDDPELLISRLQPSAHQPLIVRSSALGEDTPTASAAGQYTSVLNVTDTPALAVAIRRCMESYNSPNALLYRQNQGQAEQAIAVLIQKQIKGVFSGVAFSRDPVNPNHGAVLIEALPGEAIQVVSGHRTPERYRVFLDNPVGIEGTGDIPPQLLEKVAQLVRELEGLYHGIPQDLEWSYDGQELWLLQLRPITTLAPIWTRKIAAEVIPGVIRPLTWSINRPLTCGVWGDIFTLVLGKEAADLDFAETATLHYQRAYFNASLLGTIFRRMGLPPESLEFLTRGAKFSKPSFLATLKNLPGLLRLFQRERNLEKDFQQGEHNHFTPLLERLDKQDLNPLDNQELIQGIARILDALEKATYFSILCPLSLAIRQALAKVSLEQLDNSLAPEVASLRSLQDLAQEVKKITSNQENLFDFLEGNSSGKKILSEFQKWLEEYGYLSEVATDIAVPRWRDNSEFVRNLFIQFVNGNSNYSINSNKKYKNLQRRLDLKNKVTRIYSKLLAHLRWHFLALEANLINQGKLRELGDIFFLSYGEIKAIVAGEILEINLSDRHQEYEENLVISHVPSVVYGNSPPREILATPRDNPQRKLQGIGASAGQVSGKIKILHSLGEIEAIAPETILVVPYTDSGWAPWLCQAAGIIAEVGGVLSHGAIVAREYRIPAVMDVDKARQILRDGQRVRIDGQKGSVEILD
jgi:pyruvate,water dikinase